MGSHLGHTVDENRRLLCAQVRHREHGSCNNLRAAGTCRYGLLRYPRLMLAICDQPVDHQHRNEQHKAD